MDRDSDTRVVWVWIIGGLVIVCGALCIVIGLAWAVWYFFIDTVTMPIP